MELVLNWSTDWTQSLSKFQIASLHKLTSESWNSYGCSRDSESPKQSLKRTVIGPTVLNLKTYCKATVIKKVKF